eukprot:CAMPEP_0168322422 /NCGR_PEP_ID=MMETSP0213-20121227/2878_1 /TAXON_ID=151035 /ORGANISM="Euplotes harpa, Strain FSP1.4" /LENGTH=200 /DNA_ID=CAMNT_0008324303 /DNA_START=53 /DNA_END=655 /DNA_ORIENTATION=+
MYNFYPIFREEENVISDDMYLYFPGVKPEQESLSITEAKSTEEVSQRNCSSSLSILADDNEHDCYESIRPVYECKLEKTEDLDKIAEEIKSKIKANNIEQLLDEFVDIQPLAEFVPKGQLIIQTKKPKSNSQKNLLDQKLKEKKHWTPEDIQAIADQLGFSRRQVYKWYWDRTKRSKNSGKAQRKQNHSKFENIEESFGF